jgi:hypothetical protein
MKSEYSKVIERAEGQGILYALSTPDSAVGYRLTVSQTMHVRYDRFGAARETVRERDIRGFIAAPDVMRYFGRPVTLRLEDGRTLDLLVTDGRGTVRGDRDFYDLREGESPGYDVRRRPGPHMGYRDRES